MVLVPQGDEMEKALEYINNYIKDVNSSWNEKEIHNNIKNYIKQILENKKFYENFYKYLCYQKYRIEYYDGVFYGSITILLDKDLKLTITNKNIAYLSYINLNNTENKLNVIYKIPFNLFKKLIELIKIQTTKDLTKNIYSHLLSLK